MTQYVDESISVVAVCMWLIACAGIFPQKDGMTDDQQDRLYPVRSGPARRRNCRFAGSRAASCRQGARNAPSTCLLRVNMLKHVYCKAVNDYPMHD